MAGNLKARDPATGKWVIIPGVGPKGAGGPTGPTGATGPTGPSGLPAEEVFIGPALDPAAKPNVDFWYDSDQDDSSLREINLPTGNTVDTVLVKTSDNDQDVGWRGPHLPLTGGTVDGSVTAASMQVDGSLQVPIVTGDVHFNHNISANNITDRTAYPWVQWDIIIRLHYQWAPNYGGPGNHPSNHGICSLSRNKYNVILSLSIHRLQSRDQNQWLMVNHTAMPPEYRPAHVIGSTRLAVEDYETGPPYVFKVQPDGMIYLYVKGENTASWDEDTAFAVNMCWPVMN